jgi:hypothetical protein
MHFTVQKSTIYIHLTCACPQVCSDINKPNGQFVLTNDRMAVMTFISSLPIRKVYFLWLYFNERCFIFFWGKCKISFFLKCFWSFSMISHHRTLYRLEALVRLLNIYWGMLLVLVHVKRCSRRAGSSVHCFLIPQQVVIVWCFPLCHGINNVPNIWGYKQC